MRELTINLRVITRVKESDNTDQDCVEGALYALAAFSKALWEKSEFSTGMHTQFTAPDGSASSIVVIAADLQDVDTEKVALSVEDAQDVLLDISKGMQVHDLLKMDAAATADAPESVQ